MFPKDGISKDRNTVINRIHTLECVDSTLVLSLIPGFEVGLTRCVNPVPEPQLKRTEIASPGRNFSPSSRVLDDGQKRRNSSRGNASAPFTMAMAAVCTEGNHHCALARENKHVQACCCFLPPAEQPELVFLTVILQVEQQQADGSNLLTLSSFRLICARVPAALVLVWTLAPTTGYWVPCTPFPPGMVLGLQLPGGRQQ